MVVGSGAEGFCCCLALILLLLSPCWTECARRGVCVLEVGALIGAGHTRRGEWTAYSDDIANPIIKIKEWTDGEWRICHFHQLLRRHPQLVLVLQALAHHHYHRHENEAVVMCFARCRLALGPSTWQRLPACDPPCCLGERISRQGNVGWTKRSIGCGTICKRWATDFQKSAPPRFLSQELNIYHRSNRNWTLLHTTTVTSYYFCETETLYFRFCPVRLRKSKSRFL